MSVFVTVPTVWEIYECENDIHTILNEDSPIPPHIVIEMLVESGKARRISRVTTSKARVVPDREVEDSSSDNQENNGMPWVGR